MKPIPSDEHTFKVKITGQRTKRIYEGSFTFKLPDLRTESEISKTLARLNEGLDLDEDIELLHNILSYLHHTLVKSPEWWKEEAANLTIRDFNVYTEVRRECLNFENSWNEEIWGEPKEEKSE